MIFDTLREIRAPASTKILLLVLDGLGGLPREPGGPTELEAAATPNLDRLAREAELGLHDPVAPGIAPGSGAAHLALFGYDPLRYRIGRGVLEALGVGFPLEPGDLAARGNFCTLDPDGRVVDRRAGRLDSREAARLVARLRGIELPGVEVLVEPVREHRFLVVLRGAGLSPEVADTDPQRTGVPPQEPEPRAPAAARTAALVARFVAEARDRLRAEPRANGILLRGLSARPTVPPFEEATGLRAAGISVYPMYRGVARLVGFRTSVAAADLDEEVEVARRVWADHDLVFLHVKDPDRTGEDGDFEAKVRAIEAVDTRLPALLDLRPDVVLVTGDHSTPATMRAHSWHPVPVLLWSAVARSHGVAEFSERACACGALGRVRATDLLPLCLAHARRLLKFGA